MRKGNLGVERLNKILQQYLNPPSPKKQEKEVGDRLLREGDKVMIIKKDGTINKVMEVKGFTTYKRRYLKLWL